MDRNPKKKAIGISIILLVIGSMAFKINKVTLEFTDTWLLYTSRSEFNNVKNPCPKKVIISKYRNYVNITKVLFDQGTEIEKFVAGSKPAEIKFIIKGDKKLSTLNFFMEGRGFEVVTDSTVEKNGDTPEWSHQRREVYTPYRNILIFFDEVKGPGGDEIFKMNI